MGLRASISNVLSSLARVTRGTASVSDLKTDPGGGANVTAQHFAPAGDDSNPLPDDYALIIPGQRAGQMSAAGYVDPKNAGITAPGEKRIYARDSSGGVTVEHHLKSSGEATTFNQKANITIAPDGKITVEGPVAKVVISAAGSIKGSNGNGQFELEVAGDFVVNGVIIDTAGNITLPATKTLTSDNAVHGTSLTAGGKELIGHLHLAGIPPGNTGPNV